MERGLTQLLHPHSPHPLLGTPGHNQRQGIHRLVIEQEDHLMRTHEYNKATSVKL
jgi:hypothetical protein